MAADPSIERAAPLDKRLEALALAFAEQGWADPTAPNSAFLRDHAQTLNEFALQLQQEYVRLREPDSDDIPTNAQGVALARFLRSAFRDRTVGARVARGAAGLPDGYVFVHVDDGYEGGIDPAGRIST